MKEIGVRFRNRESRQRPLKSLLTLGTRLYFEQSTSRDSDYESDSELASVELNDEDTEYDNDLNIKVPTIILNDRFLEDIDDKNDDVLPPLSNPFGEQELLEFPPLLMLIQSARPKFNLSVLH